jgi:hypothetical protein
MRPSQHGAPHEGAGGLTTAALQRAVSRDAFSDFLPLVAWDAGEEAFLCIDDGWGYGWELVPAAYMFAHVHQALTGLLNIHFPEGTVAQLHCFADPVIDPALDAFLDLKSRPDPLIQASARRTADYLRAGTAGLDAMHGIPCATFACFSRSRAARRLGPICAVRSKNNSPKWRSAVSHRKRPSASIAASSTACSAPQRAVSRIARTARMCDRSASRSSMPGRILPSRAPRSSLEIRSPAA